MSAFGVGDEVQTPYGLGVVEEFRDVDSVYKVKLPNDTTGYLNVHQIARKKKLFEMLDEEKLALSKTYRESGNMFFKFGDFPLALNKYQLAKVYLSHLEKPDLGAQELHGLLNNIALALQKSTLYGDSIQACNEAIQLATTNAAAQSKSYYLRAVAKRKMGNLESCVEDLLQAIKFQSRSKALRDELDSVKQEMQRTKQEQAALFKNAFHNKPTKPAMVAAPKKEEEEEKKPVVAAVIPKKKQQQQKSMLNSSVATMVGVAALCAFVLVWARKP